MTWFPHSVKRSAYFLSAFVIMAIAWLPKVAAAELSEWHINDQFSLYFDA
jgi:hypothetical protein